MSSRPMDALALLRDLSCIADIASFQHALNEHGLVAADPRFMHVEVDLSNKCNLRCRMCYYSFDRYFLRPPVFLAPEWFERMADELFPHVLTLTLSLGSESLTSPHFCRLVGGLKPHRVPRVTMSTNAMLLEGDHLEAILNGGVTNLMVSLDGASRETFEWIRRGASFDQLVTNLQRLAQLKRERGSRTPVLRIDTVLMRRNLDEWEDIVRLASDLGAEEINFTHLVVYRGLDMEKESLFFHQKEFNRTRQRALDLACHLGLSVTACPVVFPSIRAKARHIARRAVATVTGTRKTTYCPFPFFHVSLNSEGEILACPFAHGQRPYGALREGGGLERIWFGEAFRELRRRILTDAPPAMCRRCSFRSSHDPTSAKFFAPRNP